ncbi:DUF2855 family protein [Alteromonas oceanisediminis]|uniref:DUF2855 family protein n=1 Tax=Alteromonas oceanisediminis TaxID=2836180 RepID=UPI001BD9CF79|nr:DUF2855 family protein [Alteromonas oceanisediminis]MBT0587470.1 DUF2855 family protein [Alteromonas oceanisediminis]
MSTFRQTQIEVQQTALVNTRQVESTLSLDDHPNAVILQVEQFGFSANNITYALLGNRFGYWGFFPASEGFGIIPVWGFARVVASNTAALNIGELVYGYLPMAGYLLVHADNISPAMFSDRHPQRRSISPVYDFYMRCDADAGYSKAMESWILTFRPLYTTSFVLAYYLQNAMQGQLERGRVIFTSASSKTAYGTAQILRQLLPDLTLIGLTSAAQCDFVESTGCYSQVHAYEEAAGLSVTENDWILDFAGDQQRLKNLREGHSAPAERTLLIGATDVEAQGMREQTTVGNVFFAPDVVREFNKDWGADTFQARYAEHWQGFVEHCSPLLKEQEHVGAQAIVKQYQQFLGGHVDPTVMHVMRF